MQAGIPTDNEVSYALIYQQETLPATGSSTSALTALGLLAVGSLVLLVRNSFLLPLKSHHLMAFFYIE
ncbi:TPA: LPXTG cell wall anchor domain-containing protein [Streptococcus pneumoniae]|uniref:LPXTG cell wall anchor domain-containing protein n=1 Tax=Streptococcus pneumoniae TaxID=1313 RepID=UPI0009918681|nr:LPXTG cell wall anchor domain-containing protein [Streptococcus pneumoniae]HET0739890.1 LPXTG cell wall anchor domain-containing protein [Streptococcus pneumoniae]HET0788873.1 LPXTG cell wall anchor domain-containing protein [Streptococcus pneumoniae]HET1188564.1 LPXTG cell wall anchor domain-containing protein [Streptococcus pneumoniae]HET1320388.1 LPXTG cell wall anchor domain-containing protein [Streptococcus pneumoniae]